MKINMNGFYCPSDTIYFNTWTKLFIKSAKFHCPWAKIHTHIFDATPEDHQWCIANNISFSTESTPAEYASSIETKKAFWVNARFIRIPELFDDNSLIISIDSDSLFKNNLSESQFIRDLQRSWVTVRGESFQSLGSAVGFGKDNFRYVLREKLLEHKDNLKWFLDQEILDQLVQNNEVGRMDRRYSDFKYWPDSIIWTGKGDRKFRKDFSGLAEEIRKRKK